MPTFHLISDFKPYVKGVAGIKGSNPLVKVPGVYVITHDETGKVYIGSTKDLARRLSSHESVLKHNRHTNGSLQRAFNEDSVISFDYRVTKSIEEAVMTEQCLVIELKDTGLLFNKAIEDVTKPSVGNTLSDEHRQRISAANKGRKRTDEMNLKSSIQRKAYLETDAGKAFTKTMASSKSKKITIDGIEYPSISEAGHQLGLCVKTVQRRAAGLPSRFGLW